LLLRKRFGVRLDNMVYVFTDPELPFIIHGLDFPDFQSIRKKAVELE